LGRWGAGWQSLYAPAVKTPPRGISERFRPYPEGRAG